MHVAICVLSCMSCGVIIVLLSLLVYYYTYHEARLEHGVAISYTDYKSMSSRRTFALMMHCMCGIVTQV